jgi:hypothetical protein
MVYHKKMGGKRRGSKKGGDASTYELKTYGNSNVQYDNVFKQVPGVNNNGFPASSNAIRTISGQVAGSRRKKHSGTRKKRGGFWGQIINQAIVPFGLVALSNKYGNKIRNKTKRRY